jgi:hypothetical protein
MKDNLTLSHGYGALPYSHRCSSLFGLQPSRPQWWRWLLALITLFVLLEGGVFIKETASGPVPIADRVDAILKKTPLIGLSHSY